jgi:hypothetical protein
MSTDGCLDVAYLGMVWKEITRDGIQSRRNKAGSTNAAKMIAHYEKSQLKYLNCGRMPTASKIEREKTNQMYTRARTMATSQKN